MNKEQRPYLLYNAVPLFVGEPHKCVRFAVKVRLYHILVAVLFESGILLGYSLVIFVGFHLWVLLYEEPILRKSFGPSFEEYCRRVQRWL